MTRGKRRQVVGVVVSDRMDKSVVVEIQRLVKQPLYKKYIRRRSRLMAHDEENTARIGDRVELVETRPLSKRKSWRVLQVLMRAPLITRVAALEPTVEEPEPEATEAVPTEVEPTGADTEAESAEDEPTADDVQPTPETTPDDVQPAPETTLDDEQPIPEAPTTDITESETKS